MPNIGIEDLPTGGGISGSGVSTGSEELLEPPELQPKKSEKTMIRRRKFFIS